MVWEPAGMGSRDVKDRGEPIRLDELAVGESGRILEVTGEDWISVRLMEMGLTEGEEIRLLGFAPLGDPIEFEVRGYRVSLRGSEARRVRVERMK